MSKDRYAPDEFIGINEIESVILKEFYWIFRRQPNPDVGIDAQIEIVDEGYPSAKFIALQIKKGSSNFYLEKSGKNATYYATSNHFTYWTESSIPVFVMGLLDDGGLYWQYASDKSLYKKLADSYRLDIPLENKLNLNSKDIIESICATHFNKLPTNATRLEVLNSILEYNDEIDYFFRVFNETISNMSNYISQYTDKTNELGDRAKNALSFSMEIQIKTKAMLVEKYTLQINILTNRIGSELNISRDHFDEIRALMTGKRDILIEKIEDKILESFLIVPQYEKLSSELSKAINSTKSMNTSIQEHPTYSTKFKKAQQNSKSTLNKLVAFLSQIRDFINEEINIYD